MLIHRANHPELAYRGGQEPLVHLDADLRRVVAWAHGAPVRWAISLANAGAGGAQTIRGFAYHTTILLGGTEKLPAGASANGNQIHGKDVISNLASGYGDTVLSGGQLTICGGGVGNSTVVESHGKAVVSSGGTFTVGTDDGTLTVSSGGHLSGGLTISGGGAANISGTVATGQTITFAGSGGDLAL